MNVFSHVQYATYKDDIIFNILNKNNEGKILTSCFYIDKFRGEA